VCFVLFSFVFIFVFLLKKNLHSILFILLTVHFFALQIVLFFIYIQHTTHSHCYLLPFKHQLPPPHYSCSCFNQKCPNTLLPIPPTAPFKQLLNFCNQPDFCLHPITLPSQSHFHKATTFAKPCYKTAWSTYQSYHKLLVYHSIYKFPESLCLTISLHIPFYIFQTP